MTVLTDLVSCYQRLRNHGLNDSHSGNASVRYGQGMWITPTGSCADSISSADLVYCRAASPIPGNASQDSRLHQEIYQRRHGINVVLHAHPVHAIALTLDGSNFRPTDFEGVLYFGTVKVVNINYDTYFKDSVEQISSALEQDDIVIARGHGVYCCAETADLAYKWINSLELSARIAWLNRQQEK